MDISHIHNFLSAMPHTANLKIHTLSVKGYHQTINGSSPLISNEELIYHLSLIFNYDGLVIIEEPSGNMVDFFDEVHEEINLFGFYIKDKIVHRLTSKELRYLYSSDNHSFNTNSDTNFFHFY